MFFLLLYPKKRKEKKKTTAMLVIGPWTSVGHNFFFFYKVNGILKNMWMRYFKYNFKLIFETSGISYT